MEKITSITRINEDLYGNVTLAYRFIIYNDVLWLNLHDICYFFNITSERFIDKFYDERNEYDKCMFLDNNNPTGISKETKYINKYAVEQLEENQRMRHSDLNYDIECLEKEKGLVMENDQNNYEFKQLVRDIKTELNKAERSELNDYVYKLVNTRQINELVEEKEYDQGLEEEVLSYKQWLQEEYDPEADVYIMRKKPVQYKDQTLVTYDKFVGPSIDEALDILYKAGLDD